MSLLLNDKSTILIFYIHLKQENQTQAIPFYVVLYILIPWKIIIKSREQTLSELESIFHTLGKLYTEYFIRFYISCKLYIDFSLLAITNYETSLPVYSCSTFTVVFIACVGF